MNKKGNENKNVKSSIKVLKDGVMELDDDIVSSVVGGMSEEVAAQAVIDFDKKVYNAKKI